MIYHRKLHRIQSTLCAKHIENNFFLQLKRFDDHS